jgi:phenylacetic acid degradation operon negative regulatory protein
MLRESNTTGPGRDTKALADRPLPARSLIASLLLRTQPPRMRGARLVQWCGLFDVAEGTTRVALSRMVERGELRARDGVYELAGRVQSRQRAQDWSLEPELLPWRGDWRVAFVEPGPRESAERAALRDAMRRLRYASRREGTWTRPDNLPRASAPAESWSVVDDQCSWWSGRPDEDPATVAEELFQATRWSERAVMLTQRLERVTIALGDSEVPALADGFVAGAAALAHVRADPLLPRELAADPGAGESLRDAYRMYERAFSDALRTWFRAH